jgi:hypothetical protein
MACHKLAFSTPESAQRTLEIIIRQGLRSPETAPKRLYQCPKCDLWHWTSMEGNSDSVRVELPVLSPRPPSPKPPAPVAPKPSPKPPPPPKKPKGTEHIVAFTAKRDRLHQQVAWLRDRMREAEQLILKGRTLDAAALLDAASSLPKSVNPVTQPEAAKRWVDDRTLEQMAYYCSQPEPPIWRSKKSS